MTDICFAHQDLYDSNGVYLQSACIITQSKSYSEAQAICQSSGMDLYDVSSTTYQTALFNFAYNYFPQGSGSTFWVKGLSPGECQAIDNAYGPFVMMLKACSTEMYSYCGYIDPTL